MNTSWGNEGRKRRVTQVALMDGDVAWHGRVRTFFSRRDGYRWLGAYPNETTIRGSLRGHPDVILAGFGEAGHSAPNVLCGLATEWPNTPILVLAASARQPPLVDALVPGVHGYLLKQFVERDSDQAIPVGLGRGMFISCEALPAILRLTQQPRLAALSCTALTPQQQRIVPYLLLGYADKEIADQLGVATSTVSTHVHWVLRKLQVPSRSEVAKRLNFGRA